MKKSVLLLSAITVVLATVNIQASNDSLAHNCFIGTSAFILFNLVPDQTNPPDFFQVNFGYKLSDKDVVSFEAITWKYNAPLGIPFGSSYDNDPQEEYPGYIRDFGIGVCYQRFLWRGLYAATHALPLVQNYIDKNNNRVQIGFMLFLTFRMGYHLEIFRNRFFFEPSLAATHWPIRTNVPSGFSEKEKKWPNYFLFEPGFHCGFLF